VSVVNSDLVLHVGVAKRGPAQLVRLQVDHSTSTDGGWRRLLQICRLKHQIHVVRHLDNFATHQTQLQPSTSPVHPYSRQQFGFKGGGGSGRPLPPPAIGSCFPKSRFFCVKGIYFVVRHLRYMRTKLINCLPPLFKIFVSVTGRQSTNFAPTLKSFLRNSL